MKQLSLILMLFILVGCSHERMLEIVAPEDMKEMALEYLEALRKGTGAETYLALDESQKNDQTKSALAILAREMPDGAYTRLTFVNFQLQKRDGKKSFYFVFEYDFNGRYLLADVTLRKNDDSISILGLHARENPQSVIQTNKFDFDEAGLLHYGFLGAAVILPIFSIITLVKCIRTKGIKRKWLWYIFIMIGFCTFELNWQTGEWLWQPLSFQILSAGAFSSGAYGPWIIGFSIPIGAVAFWCKRRKPKAQAISENIA